LWLQCVPVSQWVPQPPPYMPTKHASVASPPRSRAVTLTCFRAALTSPTPSPFKEVRARVDAKGPQQRSGAGHGWRGRGPNNTDAVAGERADADRIPLLPVVHLVGADGSQTRSASMKIWRLKAAPPTDPKGFNRSLGWEEGHSLSRGVTHLTILVKKINHVQ
jgi:hypothetical protein